MSRELAFTALFPFGGLGAGARGFLDARSRLFDFDLTFRCLGGLDFDAEACADFEYLTGVPSWCVDVLNVTAAELRARYGRSAPDCVFLSPPCKGASGLLPKYLADTEKYLRMNELALVWTRVMLEAWAEDPPKLVLLENVPRLKTRASAMLTELKRLLRRAGYRLHEGYHCCGEIGGLAQRRRRYLLVARLETRCPNLLYQPPKKRVRACGEVLERLPVPATPEAHAFGRIHELPGLSWLNWVRLALIPPGGDWRDLEGVLAEEREAGWFGGVLGVRPWDGPVQTVTGRAGVSTGAFAVADPRGALALPRSEGRHWNKYAVGSWGAPARTVIGKIQPGSGGPAVADPRVRFAFDAGYAVLSWEQAARTIASKSFVGCGAYAVAEPRPGPPFNLELEEALRAAAASPRRPPRFLPVILSRDGSWHRPLTTLELASLQGLPTSWRGAPLLLAGRSQTRWRERIGNAVPVTAARSIAERMLLTLGASALCEVAGSGDVWVAPPRAPAEDGIELRELHC